jgi:hypothetical protein
MRKIQERTSLFAGTKGSSSCVLLLVFFVWITSAQAQIGLGLASDRPEYLLYEPIEIKITVSNQTPDPMDLSRSAGGKGPWLDFYVTTSKGQEIMATNAKWSAPKLILPSADTESFFVNITPLFEIREAGKYEVTAQVRYEGEVVGSRTLAFQVVNGAAIWEKTRKLIPSSKDPEKTPRVRNYSLLVHRQKPKDMLYLRIIDPENELVYCTTPLGPITNFKEPTTILDVHGNIHVFHRSGIRVFTYSLYSPNGKKINTRFFSNIGSEPQLVYLDNHEIQVVGGEENFEGKDRRHSFIPTAPAAEPSEGGSKVGFDR